MFNFFLFVHENICCRYSLEVPHGCTSNEYSQHMFLLTSKKNIYLKTPLIGSYDVLLLSVDVCQLNKKHLFVVL